MGSINKVLLLGNLGKDPEARRTASDELVVNFSIATSTFSNKNGERREYTEWHRCVCFNKAAEIAERYLRKGSQVFIEGSLRTKTWKDKEGRDQKTTEITVGVLTMLGKPADSDSARDREPAPMESPDPLSDLDEEIPF
jgi:single-strand DNA-binding protein